MEYSKLKKISELTKELDQCEKELADAFDSNNLSLYLLKMGKFASVNAELDAVKSTTPKQPDRERKWIACPTND